MNDVDAQFLGKLKDVMLRAFEIVKKNMREKNARAMKNFYSKFDMNQKRVGKEHNNFEQLHVIRGEVENVNSNY